MKITRVTALRDMVTAYGNDKAGSIEFETFGECLKIEQASGHVVLMWPYACTMPVRWVGHSRAEMIAALKGFYPSAIVEDAFP